MVKYDSDEIFAALAHPVRRQIAERLARAGRIPLSQLAKPFPISLPAVMNHVDVLEKSGLVVSSKEGRVNFIAMNPEALASGMSWFLSMERMWGDRFDRLGAHLTNPKEK